MKVSHCTHFDPEANGMELWEDLQADGALQSTQGMCVIWQVKYSEF